MDPNTRRNILIAILIVLVVYFFWDRSPNEPKVEPKPVAEEPAASETPAETEPQEPPAPAAQAVTPPTTKSNPGRLPEEEIKRTRAQIRAALSSLYSAMKAYYFEFGSYSTDLVTVGWAPGEANLLMKAGFIEPGPSTGFEGEDPRRSDTDAFLSETLPDGRPRFSYARSAQNVSLQDARNFCENRCTATERGFEVMAAANLDDDPDLDVWIINERKELVQVSDDVGN